MEKNKIGQLCYWMVRQKEGQEILKAIKDFLTNDPVFPKPPEFIASFGGTEAYMAFRAGQVSIVRFIELHAQGYIDQENALKDKQNKDEVKKAKKERK